MFSKRSALLLVVQTLQKIEALLLSSEYFGNLKPIEQKLYRNSDLGNLSMAVLLRASIVILLCVLIGEMVTRAFVTSPSPAQSDPELGWVYRPGVEIFHTKEGWGRNQMNSLGLNDVPLNEMLRSKNVAVLGDSFAEALQVERKDNFSEYAESLLSCANVVNAGRSGMALTHFPAMAKRLSKQIRLDHIHVVLNNWDFDDTLAHSGILKYDDNNGLIDIEVEFRQQHKLRRKAAFIFDHSALATFLLERIKLVNQGRVVVTPVTKASHFEAPASAELQKFTDIFTFVTAELTDIAPVSIIYIPKLEYSESGRSKLSEDSYYFQELLRKLAKSSGVEFTSAGSRFQAVYALHLQPPVGFHNAGIKVGHLNTLGHAAVGQVLVADLAPICASLAMGDN